MSFPLLIKQKLLNQPQLHFTKFVFLPQSQFQLVYIFYGKLQNQMGIFTNQTIRLTSKENIIKSGNQYNYLVIKWLRWRRSIIHLLAAWRACPCLIGPGIAVMRIRLFESRPIGTSTRPEDGEGTPQVRLMYTLWILCSLNCFARWAWECSSCHWHVIS